MIRGLGEPISREIKKIAPNEYQVMASAEDVASLQDALGQMQRTGQLLAQDAAFLMQFVIGKQLEARVREGWSSLRAGSDLRGAATKEQPGR